MLCVWCLRRKFLNIVARCTNLLLWPIYSATHTYLNFEFNLHSKYQDHKKVLISGRWSGPQTFTLTHRHTDCCPEWHRTMQVWRFESILRINKMPRTMVNGNPHPSISQRPRSGHAAYNEPKESELKQKGSSFFAYSSKRCLWTYIWTWVRPHLPVHESWLYPLHEE